MALPLASSPGPPRFFSQHQAAAGPSWSLRRVAAQPAAADLARAAGDPK